jgi:hypothetical protein
MLHQKGYISDPVGIAKSVCSRSKDCGGKTRVVMHELYPSKEALDTNAGMENGMPETFAQLDELLVTLGASVGRS